MNHVTRARVGRGKWHETIQSSHHRVSTGVKQNFAVPLTIADVHLRQEQLPFAYFFPKALCQDRLLSSLAAILPQFSVLGGAVLDDRCLAIQCTTTDSVNCTFATSDQSIEYWLLQRNVLLRCQSPELLPLFEPLPSLQQSLASIKITTLQDKSTVIGMTVTHMVADAASCFHFLTCWGNEMQNLSFMPRRKNDAPRNRLSNDRSIATCSGMMTHEIADVMGLVLPEPSWTEDLWSIVRSDGTAPSTKIPSHEHTNNNNEHSDHDYVHLTFPNAVLVAMKAHGMYHSQRSHASHGGIDFVSMNDTVTAFGWLMKRELSGQSESNVSIVVNLRGRFGIDAIKDNGLFGNGIAHFTATLPGQATSEDEAALQISLDDVSAAALAIRTCLIDAIRDTPDRLSRSRLRQSPRESYFGPSFSTTEWGSFPIWDIQFGKGAKIIGFHGQPSHPMPPGEMFSSVIVPNEGDDGITYQLLAPQNKEKQAREIHQRLCSSFLSWHAVMIEKNVELLP